MALQAGGLAPYTTSQAAITVIDWFRDKAPIGPLIVESITRAGVSESLANRTLNSLRMLDLIDSDGKPSEQFQDLQKIRGEEEYRTRLQEWLRGAYADILQYCDPSQDSYEKVVEAFRGYQPQGQRRAMATLLLGLWRYAGLPLPSGKALVGDIPRPKPRQARKARAGDQSRHGGSPNLRESAGESDLPAGLVGLLHQIPKPGGSWTKDTRDNFLAAFTAVLDFSVPIGDPETLLHEEEEVVD